MSSEKITYSISWSQVYTNWIPVDVEIIDLTEAREVLARIMAK